MSSERPSSSSSTPSQGPALLGPRGGRPAMGAPVEKAKIYKGTIGRLISYLRPFWSHIGTGFCVRDSQT